MKPAGATGGILSRPAAAVALAGSLSVLTLAASLYLFMFAGRDLLPPPPIAGIPATRILEPVPMNSLSALAPEIEVAAVSPLPTASAMQVFLAANIPAAVTSAAPSGATGTVAGVYVEPFTEDDDNEDDDDRPRGQKEGQKKNKQSESSSISASNSSSKSNFSNGSKVSRHKD